MTMPDPDLRQEHEQAVANFFETVRKLLDLGVDDLQHSEDSTLLAYNLPQIRRLCAQHGLKLPSTRFLNAAFRASDEVIERSPVPIKSRWTNRKVMCWLFGVL